jgi:hypothetical protein
VTKAFKFEHGGRTYTCTTERMAPPVGTWWWFTVSSDSNRYAPFEAAAGDTPESIRSRIVEYYEHRLWARAQPSAQRQQFGRSGRSAERAAPPTRAKPRAGTGDEP